VIAEGQRTRAERQEYAAHINLAQQAWETENFARMEELLDTHVPKTGQKDLRSFEWYYLWRLCHPTHPALFTLRHANAILL